MLSLRSKVEYGAARAGLGKPELHLRQLEDMIARSPDYRGHIARLDFVGRRHIQFRLMRRDAKSEILHHLAVFGVADLLLILAAHRERLSVWHAVVAHRAIDHANGWNYRFDPAVPLPTQPPSDVSSNA
ncbi:hypothetical protein D9M72_605870 [compost metagenome]